MYLRPSGVILEGAYVGEGSRRVMSDRTNCNGASGVEEQELSHVIWIAGQFVMMPATTFIYGVELFVKVMREMQKTTLEQMEEIAKDCSKLVSVTTKNMPNIATLQPETSHTLSKTQFLLGHTNDLPPKEEEALNSNDSYSNGIDKNLNDDMLKLVRFKILFVKRDFEHAFAEQEELVFDNISGADFTAWKIAEFIQKLNRCKNEREPDRVRIPEKWRRKCYPTRDYSAPASGDWTEIEELENEAKRTKKAADETVDATKVKAAKEAAWEAEKKYEKKKADTPPYYLVGVPEEDKKFLRLFYQVLERYSREKFKHDERQIEVLEQIRNALDR